MAYNKNSAQEEHIEKVNSKFQQFELSIAKVSSRIYRLNTKYQYCFSKLRSYLESSQEIQHLAKSTLNKKQ